MTVVVGLLVIWVIAAAAFWGLPKLRDIRSEKSIEDFHQGHATLARRRYAVEPTRRLADAYQESALVEPESNWTPPRLRVVQEHDTYSTLESSSSWDDWDREYEFDDRVAAPVAPSSRYAAYSSTPTVSMTAHHEELPRRHGSMKVRRTRIFSSLTVGAIVTSLLKVAVGLSLLQDLAILLWVATAAYLALAFYAVSQGYISDSLFSFNLHLSRGLAPVEPLYRDEEYVEEVVDEYYQPNDDAGWRRETSRYALG